MKKDHGTVNYEGKTYRLTQDAFVNNVGTSGEYAYYAHAIDDKGDEYLVTWTQTEEFRKVDADYCLAMSLVDERNHRPLYKDEQAEYDRLVDEGYIVNNTPYPPSLLDDETLACDWDNPIDVRPV